MKQSEAWVVQAKSDLAAAQVVFKESDASTYCQAIANYQQVAEKSIKGMIAAMNELGISQVSISGNHTLEHEMNGLDSLRRKRPNLDDASIGAIDRLIRGYRADIIFLSSLAPKLPKLGTAYPRNTEYPYNDASPEGWIAPAAQGAFALAEVRKLQRVAWPLYRIAANFQSSLRRRREENS